ncbi:MAG: acyl-CoA thioesterase [Burkholderiales bacterium]
MSKIFSVEYPILFSHCDPAGIVYFPRLFDLLHRAMEDWFTFGLQERFADFIMKKGLGVPAVGTQVDFVGPARFGDLLRIELRVLTLGRSSIVLGIDAFVGKQPCFKARHTVCCFSQHTLKAVPIPDDLRDRMTAYVAADSGAAAKT